MYCVAATQFAAGVGVGGFSSASPPSSFLQNCNFLSIPPIPFFAASGSSGGGGGGGVHRATVSRCMT